MSLPTTKTHAAIDKVLEATQGKPFRNHLGASIIGRDCPREVWYTFRWHKVVRHRARILRLFDRGNLEENRFTGWLKKAGIEVRTIDPETGKQYRVVDHNGHFGGSLDAEIRDCPDWDDPDVWLNGEYKTHSNKSFNDLVAKKVKKSKFPHYVQMQIYMHKRGRPAALYMAINKDNDELYTELVYYDSAVAEMYLDRAYKIIHAPEPPPRISESPAYYICRFCDYSDICHDGAPPALNCRSCVNIQPLEDGDGAWICKKFNYPLSEEEQRRGCTQHQPILS